MTKPEERAGWPMHTGFAGNADATACAPSASGVDKSITEPEKHAGWQMHAGFVGKADATASSATAFGNAGAEVGTETTTALRFGWGV